MNIQNGLISNPQVIFPKNVNRNCPKLPSAAGFQGACSNVLRNRKYFHLTSEMRAIELKLAHALVPKTLRPPQ